MRPRNGALVVVVFVLAAFAWGRAAQTDRGILAGTIKDVSGAAVPGVRVEAQGPVTASAVTDARGAFRIVNLVPGDYVVTATLAGFATTTTRASISPRNETRIALELRDGSLNETVVVTGQAPSVDAQTSARQVTEAEQFRRADSQRPVQALAAAAAPPFLSDPVERRRRGHNTESYDHLDENGFKHVSADPLSTFSVDVDTASYANVRRFLREGRLPEPGAVRVEELINYFRLPYAEPDGPEPFSITTELAECPWNPGAPPGPHRHPGARGDEARAGAAQPRVPDRRVGLDGVARQAAAGAERDADAGGRARASAIASRSWSTPARADWCCRPRPGRDKATIARAIAELRTRRLDQRRGGHSARLPRSRASTSSAAASTAWCWPPTATSTWASRARTRWCGSSSGSASRACSCRCSASAPATSRTRRWRSSPTRATATTPTSTRCTRRARCSSGSSAARSTPSPRT